MSCSTPELKLYRGTSDYLHEKIIHFLCFKFSKVSETNEDNLFCINCIKFQRHISLMLPTARNDKGTFLLELKVGNLIYFAERFGYLLATMPVKLVKPKTFYIWLLASQMRFFWVNRYHKISLYRGWKNSGQYIFARPVVISCTHWCHPMGTYCTRRETCSCDVDFRCFIFHLLIVLVL